MWEAAALDEAVREARVRKVVGRELHDGPAQSLALAGYALDQLMQAQSDDPTVAADARRARDLIDRAVLEMRAIIQRLRTAPEPAPSATGPLRAIVAEWEPTAPDLAVEIDQLSGVRLAPEVETAVVGIVREALHNVRKHAQAQSVRLEVRRDETGVEVSVIDDGVGCDGRGKPGHFGLDQIRELAEGSGGSVTVGATPSAGTAVRAHIPVAATATGRLALISPDARQSFGRPTDEPRRGTGSVPDRQSEQGER